MPIYEYKCEACGKKFEVLQKFSDEPLLVHPECGGKVDKLISTSALQFKGSGWYVTDYGKKSAGGDSSKSEKSETSEKSGKPEKSEKSGKSEKPESKSASSPKEQKKTGSASKEK